MNMTEKAFSPKGSDKNYLSEPVIITTKHKQQIQFKLALMSDSGSM